MSNEYIGYLLVLLALICDGSYGAFAKLEQVSRLHPALLGFFLCCGLCLTSFCFLPWGVEYGQPFTWYGVLSGIILSPGVGLFVGLAIQCLGLSQGVALWSALAIITSFLWGSVGPSVVREPIASVPLSLLAIAALLTGILGVVYCEPLGRRLRSLLASNPYSAPNSAPGAKRADAAAPEKAPAGKTDDAAGEWVVSDGPGGGFVRRGSTAAADPMRLAVGCVAALVVGVTGGSFLIPLYYDEGKGDLASRVAVSYMPSVGLGALLGGALCTAVSFAAVVAQGGALPTASQVRAAALPGLAMGFLFAIDVVCQLVALDTYDLPYATVFPLVRCNVVVAGLWGICAFGELRDGASIAVFFASCGAVLIGAVLLALYGPQESR